jgi:hypothetical protein
MVRDDGFWKSSHDAFDAGWQHLGFRGQRREDVGPHHLEPSVGGVSETIVEFQEDRRVQISLHNRGVDGAIQDRQKFEGSRD